MECLELKKISAGLEFRDGIWVSKSKSGISFPENGYNRCFQFEEHSFWFIHRNNCIIETVKNFPPAGCFFDIGGGNGFVSIGLEKNGINTCLVEPGMEGILNARKRKLRNLVCSSFDDAHFHENSLPAIGAFDLIEHIDNDSSFLSKLAEALIYNGRLFLTVPAFNTLWSSVDDYSGHFRRYTLKSMSSKLKAAGFEIEYGTYIFSILPIPIFLFLSIPDRIVKKKDSSLQKSIKQHNQKANITNKVLNKIWEKELSFIKRKRRIPIGGSCLFVAKNLRR
ncbi:class I SAM-dependent methyltransferase [Acidobacteriota bacterium]